MYSNPYYNMYKTIFGKQTRRRVPNYKLIKNR